MKSQTTKIVIFSDLHYSPEKPENSGSEIQRKLVQYAEPLLDKLISEINDNIKPNLVLNLGDLIKDFNDHDRDIELLKYVWNKFSQIRHSFYSCIGNHDLCSMTSREEVEKIMGYKHSTFSFNINNLHIVILGTCVNNDMGNADGGIYKTRFVSNEDLEWLKHDLSQNKLPCIICSHFGIAEDTMKGHWWYDTRPEAALLGNRKELKEIINQHENILAVFSGHQHWTKTIIEQNIPYHILGSLVENINQDNIPDGVYFIVDIDGDKMKVTEKHLRL